jgi:hypothetical protein
MAGISFEEAAGGGSTTSKGISFDEAVAPATSASAPVEGSSGAAFGVYPKPGMKPNDELSRSARNIGRSALEASPATAAGLYGFGAGMAAVATPAAAVAAVPVVGPFAAATLSLSTGLGTAFVASGAAQKVTDWMHEVFAPEDYAQRKAEKEAHPYEAFAGQTLANLAGMSPRTAPEIAGKFMSKPIVQRATSGALQTGIEAGTQYATEGEFDPIKLGVAATTGVGMPGFNVVGRVPFAAGERLGQKISSMLPGGTKKVTPDVTSNTDLPPKVDPLSTPEEQAAVIEKLKKISAEKNANSVMLKDNSRVSIETAPAPEAFSSLVRMEHGEPISLVAKNASGEEVGKLTYMPNGGPIDVFVREGDRRKGVATALYDALEARGGKILPVDSGVAISEDARAFRTARENVSDQKPYDPNQLATRDDYKEAIDNNETQRMSLEAQAEEAAGIGNEERVTSINEQIKKLEQEHAQLIKDMPPQKTLAYEFGDVQEYADRYSTTTESTKDAFVNWLHKSEMPLDPAKIAEYEQQFISDIETPKTKVIKDSSEVPKSIKDMLQEDGSKPDPRDMKDEDDFYKTAVEIYEKSGEKAALDFYDGYKQYKQTWLEPVKETEKFVGINLDNKLAGERITSNNKADILDIAKKDNVNLEQLTYKIDRGDKLDGAEKTIADKFRTLMDDLGKRALEAGVIKGWHEDYVARNVISEGSAPPNALKELMKDIFGGGSGGSGGSKTTTKYGEQRRLKTREDLLRHLDGINGWLAENGKDYRFKLKTDNLAEIYADYAHSVEKAIENKNLITNLKQVRNAAGESLIRPITKDDPLPHGWEVMDNSELAGYAVHPDLLPALKFVFDAGPGQLMQALGTVSQITKRINVVGSFFHAKSLMEVLSSAEIPIWTPLKEAIVLPLVEKSVKKLTGKELQLSAITKAVDQYRNGGAGDNVDKWIKEGRLQLDAPEDVARGILSSIGKAADSLIGKYGPKTRVLESSLSTVEKYTLGLFDKYTWDYLHTGGKLMVADAYLDKARFQAAKEGKPFDETAARIEISRFVNDSFGGLNWFDAAAGTQNEFAKRMAMAAYSPQGRRALQLALFAPDWTISTLRAFTAALPKSLNPTKLSPVEGIKGMINPTTKSDYARLYQFKTALTYLTLINAINLMVANRPVWENKDPTRIEFPDGTSMQAMKHAMEPVHWIMDPAKTLSNKLGFLPKAAIIGIAGTEYASPDAPKLVDRSAYSRLKTALSGALPFQVSAAMSAPEGEGAKRALLGTMGFPVYGSTAEQRKLKAAERELQTKELAYQYREKEIKAGREKMTPKHIKEGNMLRKRREEMDRKMGK